jgi:uncharacterized protein DUF5995
MAGRRRLDEMSDSTLLAVASAGPAETYSDVVARLRAIEAELDEADGLIWFNRLYATMTSNVIDAARRHRFDDAAFLERLDCHFANLYFVALAAHLSDPGTGPPCWEPLFQARDRRGVLPFQYALAGINAHINRDLPVALVTTFIELNRAPVREGPEHADYLKINSILEGTFLEARVGLLTRAQHDWDVALGELDDVLAMFSVKRARDAAWVSAEVRWALRASPVISRHHLEALDRLVGLASRGLLLPRSPTRGLEAGPLTPARAGRSDMK